MQKCLMCLTRAYVSEHSGYELEFCIRQGFLTLQRLTEETLSKMLSKLIISIPVSVLFRKPPVIRTIFDLWMEVTESKCRASHEVGVAVKRSADSSCYSYIGRQGGSQDIGIGDGCQYQIGIVLHEMAHAIGFLHEHNRYPLVGVPRFSHLLMVLLFRPDRDNYVTIKFDRIRERKRSV